MRIITIVSSLICHTLLFGASLTLKQGWNLVGLPGDGWISTSTLLERTPNISIVWGYNAPTQEWRLKTRKSIDSPYASLDSIATGQGVWIKVDQDTSIDFDVGEASDLNLSTFGTGWHLFSTPNAIDTAKLGATHPSNYLIIWAYRHGEWYLWQKTESSHPSGIARLNSINAGEGFWLKIQ